MIAWLSENRLIAAFLAAIAVFSAGLSAGAALEQLRCRGKYDTHILNDATERERVLEQKIDEKEKARAAAERGEAIARSDLQYLHDHPPKPRIVRLCRALLHPAAGGENPGAAPTPATTADSAGDSRGMGAVEISTRAADDLITRCAVMATDFRELQERIAPLVTPE